MLEEQVRKDKEMFVWLTAERDRLLDLNAEEDIPQEAEEEVEGLRLSADAAEEDVVDNATNGNPTVSTTALWSQLETVNATKATQQRRLVELEGQITRDREISSAQLSTVQMQLATMTKMNEESIQERNVAVSNLASLQKEMMTLKNDKATIEKDFMMLKKEKEQAVIDITASSAKEVAMLRTKIGDFLSQPSLCMTLTSLYHTSFSSRLYPSRLHVNSDQFTASASSPPNCYFIAILIHHHYPISNVDG